MVVDVAQLDQAIIVQFSGIWQLRYLIHALRAALQCDLELN